MSTLAVLIVSYRTPSVTVAAVRSALDVAGVNEVVVVDNGSDDDTLADLDRLGSSRVRTFANGRNMGFGVAANRAAREAESDVLLFLNSDAQLTTLATEELTSELLTRNGRAIVGPRIVDPSGTVQRTAGLLPGPFDLVVRALGVSHLAQRAAALPVAASLVRRSRTMADYASALDAIDTLETSMVTGACFAIGREAFWELGGFDERFFMYFEDADLCKRAAAAGMPIRYVPSAVVTHIGGASSEGDYRFSPMHARSMRQYLEKWWGLPGAALAILLLWLRLVGHALVLHPSTSKAFAAFRAAVRG